MVHLKKMYGKKVPTYYYTKEEADKLGLEYRYWKEATEVGQWLVDDCGLMSKCTKIKHYNDKFILIRTELFAGNKCRKVKIDLAEKIRTKSIATALTYSPWWAKLMKANPWILDVFIEGLYREVIGFEGKEYTKANKYFKEASVKYPFFNRASKKTSVYSTLSRMWYNEGVRKMIRDSFQRMCDVRGLTQEHSLDLIVEAETYARARKDGRLLLAVAEKIERLNVKIEHGNQQQFLEAPSDERLNNIYNSIMKHKQLEEAVVLAQG